MTRIRPTHILLTLIAVVFIAASARALWAQGKTSSSIPAPVSLSTGRWQVVNGAPEFRGMVMLLDTATGDTWISCVDEEGANGWCKMFRSSVPSTTAKPK